MEEKIGTVDREETEIEAVVTEVHGKETEAPDPDPDNLILLIVKDHREMMIGTPG